ncbi:hypothetical protein [Hymenobacter properus]|uniref:Uncharacterized protein n=1 Tax=Hymenobacter properus TaxID=2791026 RepID=A0A931BFI7_9BACT|nr:hypothetical protein [Hymenobacter properus]MBF9141576.1 hypothetical protein [Hymenobacter properus]MBR7720385.1 hypothetical protein [Microvirga sp. SRT04]
MDTAYFYAVHFAAMPPPPPPNLTRLFVVLACLGVAMVAIPFLVGVGISLYESYTGNVIVEEPNYIDALRMAHILMDERLHYSPDLTYPKASPEVKMSPQGHFIVQGKIFQFVEPRFIPFPYVVELQYLGPKCMDTTSWKLIRCTVPGLLK